MTILDEGSYGNYMNLRDDLIPGSCLIGRDLIKIILGSSGMKLNFTQRPTVKNLSGNSTQNCIFDLFTTYQQICKVFLEFKRDLPKNSGVSSMRNSSTSTSIQI